jgi:hypothetical protein
MHFAAGVKSLCNMMQRRVKSQIQISPPNLTTNVKILAGKSRTHVGSFKKKNDMPKIS